MGEVEVLTFKDETKHVIRNIINSIQVYGFWCVIVLMIGFYFGIVYCNKTRSNDISNSIKLKAFIYDMKVYEVKERLLQ